MLCFYNASRKQLKHYENKNLKRNLKKNFFPMKMICFVEAWSDVADFFQEGWGANRAYAVWISSL